MGKPYYTRVQFPASPLTVLIINLGLVKIKRNKKRQSKSSSLIPDYNVNEDIKADKVRLLDEDEEHIGVVPLKEALSKAKDKDLDLVEINPKANPTVARIVDYSSFRYQKEKEAKKKRKKSRSSKTKGVRISMSISEHDLNVRLNQAKKFLERGDKVKIELILKGRQHQHKDRAKDKVRDFIDKIKEDVPVKFEQEVQEEGYKITAQVVKN